MIMIIENKYDSDSTEYYNVTENEKKTIEKILNVCGIEEALEEEGLRISFKDKIEIAKF